jgi:hypothetical protein
LTSIRQWTREVVEAANRKQKRTLAMREVAEDVASLRVSGTAHWIAEENPQAVVSDVLEFIGAADSG